MTADSTVTEMLSSTARTLKNSCKCLGWIINFFREALEKHRDEKVAEKNYIGKVNIPFNDSTRGRACQKQNKRAKRTKLTSQIRGIKGKTFKRSF